MTEPKERLTETLIEGYRKGVIGNGHPNVVKAAVVETPSPAVGAVVGESPARQRKAAQQRPEPCPHAPNTRPVCQREFRGPKCCAWVTSRQCQPPAQVRKLFTAGFEGDIECVHIEIAAGCFRDAKAAD